MKRVLPLLVLVTAFLASQASACTKVGVGQAGFTDSRPEFMEAVKKAMAASNIRYREDADGCLRYATKDRAAVDRIMDSIEAEMSAAIAFKVENRAERDFLSGILSSMGRKHWVQPRDDGEWILWNPRSEAEKRDVQTKLVRYRFDSRNKAASK